LIRSTNQELGEYDLIRGPEHIAQVWSAIEAALPMYWEKFVQQERRQEAEREYDVLARVFEDAVASYEKEAQKYRRFFEPEMLDEFHDDPNAFKQALSRDLPVIANPLRSRRAELKEWQYHFRPARAKDLLEVFSNILDFVTDWSEAHPVDGYNELDEPEAFGLNPLDDDESMSMVSVIGMGIISMVLYHLDPSRLPPRGWDGLYGLYFLSGRDHFGLPSKSSEFLMVNDISPASDGSLIMDQNYWYPYGLFSLYVLRVFKWMDQHTSNVGFTLDRSVRHVYVKRFFTAVCGQHTDDLKTMRAHERFEVPA
jgi:hypothetical protein